MKLYNHTTLGLDSWDTAEPPFPCCKCLSYEFVNIIYCWKIVLYNYIPSDFVMFLQLTLVTVFVLLSFFIIAIAYVQNVLSFQFSSVTQSCPTICDPKHCSTPGLPVHHQLLELAQTHVHRVGEAIQPSHPLSSPSPPAFNLFQHQGLFKWVNSSHQVAKVLEFQLQHQSFQWILRTDFL